MINLYPCDFVWSHTNEKDVYQIQYGDYRIEDIENYIMNDLGVRKQVYLSGDQYQKQFFEKQYSLKQYQLFENCVIYVYINPQQINNQEAENLITVKTRIDDGEEIEIQVQGDSAIYEIINTLQEQSIISQNIVHLKLNDPKDNLLATDQQMQFLHFKQFNSFKLYLYTQTQTLQTSSQNSQQFKLKAINKIDQARDLLKQLIVFPKMSILIDKDGDFVVYKYHFPLSISGYLEKKKGKKRKIDEEQYDFKSSNKIKYAQTDEFGIIISWGDSLYSQIRVQQQG